MQSLAHIAMAEHRFLRSMRIDVGTVLHLTYRARRQKSMLWMNSVFVVTSPEISDILVLRHIQSRSTVTLGRKIFDDSA